MWASNLFTVTVGVIAVILGVVILVVDETKSTATYIGVGGFIVIGLGLILAFIAQRGRAHS